MDEMQDSSMRNMLLSELIDNMHSRLADKMFPPDPSKEDQPAVEGIVGEMHTEDGAPIPSEYPPAAEDEPTDEEIEEMMK